MAFTKVAPAGIGSTPGDGYRIGDSFLHSTGVEITNINATGIVTAASLDISGAIDFDGHTELDNVNISGVSTFAGNIDANGDLDVDGHTELDNVSVAGVSTFAGNVVIADSIVHDGDPNTQIRFPDPDTIRFEVGNQQAVHILPASAGSGGARMGMGTNNPTGMLHIYGSNPPVRIQNSNDSANLQFGMWDTANIMFQASHRTFKFATETSHPIVFHTGGLNNERLRIDSSGRLLLGHTASVEGGSSSLQAKLQVSGTDFSSSAINLQRYQNNSTAAAIAFNKSRNGTQGSHTILQDGDELGKLIFYGSDGNDFQNEGARITVQVDGTPGNNVMPGSLIFKTTAQGAVGSSERLRIESDGDVIWNGTGTVTPGYSNSTVGMGFEPRNGTIFLSRADNLVLHTNRNNDGRIINFSQGGNQKFNIGLKNSGADLAFNSGTSEGTERLRIASNGNIKIGSGAPAIAVGGGLEIDTGSAATIRLEDSGSTSSFEIQNSSSVITQNMYNNQPWTIAYSGSEKLRITSDGSFIVGSTSYGAAGSFSVAANGSFRQVIAAGTAQDTLLNAISGVSNGFQLTTDASNNQTYKFHNGSTITNIIKSNGYFGTGTSNPVAQFVVSKANGEGVEFVPGNRTDENDIYHYDRGSNVYCGYRTYATKHEFWRAGTSQAVEVTPAGNLKVYGGAGLRLACRSESHSDYVSLENDNHGNTLLGLNLQLNYSGNSGTYQVKQVNAHGSIGSAGMFIGGNGSGNNTDICFFRNGQGSSAGTVFGQQDWKFRIGSEIVTNYNLMQRMRGYFRTDTSYQTASNGPALAGANSYAYGYQEAYSTSGGTWVHPYPDLVIGYHTGVSLGGYPNYGGCRFFTDHPSSSSTMIFSVGNGNNGVAVVNSLSKGGGSFRIAHPHPSKKYTHDLQHSFIEGPQCDNIYRGKIDLVAGSASINIDTVSNMTDGTFVLLNRDIQCFTSNETGWTAVKGSVSGNILTITAQDNSCTDTISWMVIGERQDDKIKSPEMEMTDSDGKLIVEPLTIEESHM